MYLSHAVVSLLCWVRQIGCEGDCHGRVPDLSLFDDDDDDDWVGTGNSFFRALDYS